MNQKSISSRNPAAVFGCLTAVALLAVTLLAAAVTEVSAYQTSACTGAADSQVAMVSIGGGNVLQYGSSGVCVLTANGKAPAYSPAAQTTFVGYRSGSVIPVSGSSALAAFPYMISLGDGTVLRYGPTGFTISGSIK